MSGIKLRPIVFKVDPPLPYTLLYEQAVQNYVTQNGIVTIMSGRTWDTTKNFICYKINLKVNGDTLGSGNTHDRGVWVSQQTGEYDWSSILCGRLVAADYYNTVPKNTSFVQIENMSSATVGSAGQSFTGDWDNANTFRANPSVVTTDAVTYKFVFDIAQHKAYCYIGNAQVCIADFGTRTPYTWDLTTQYGSTQDGTVLDVDCGIQVYACDSLEAAEQC